MITVRRADATDWPAVKAIRLRALADSPDAFASSLVREEAFDEEVWRSRVTGAAWFLAGDGAAVVGVACGIPEPGDPDGRHLVGMWVEPGRRGSGTADQLVEAVRTWAREDGGRKLALWVVEGNARARRFYARAGFRATGERQPLPGRDGLPELPELRMVARL